jgi:hypothetical protein
VGFYGGVCYGFGYTGVGFSGGYWRGRTFFYNRAVTHITNVHITNVYTRNVVQPEGGSRASYNGGEGGTHALPSPGERIAMHEHHVEPTAAQSHHQELAAHDRTLHASFNHGHPALAATPRPGLFAHAPAHAPAAAHPQMAGHIVGGEPAQAAGRGQWAPHAPTAAGFEPRRGAGEAPRMTAAVPQAPRAAGYGPAAQPPHEQAPHGHGEGPRRPER